MLQRQSIVCLGVKIEPVGFTARLSASPELYNSIYLRDYQTVLFCAQEIELKSMTDAARLVNGRNVRHNELLVIAQLLRYLEAPDREANGVVEAP